MLKDILREIKETKVYSQASLSRKFNISPPMVEEAMDQLIRMNYLKEDLAPSCQGGCLGCPIKNCNQNPVKTYTITEKGENLLL